MSSFEFSSGDSFPLVLGLRDSHGDAVTPPPGATAIFRMTERLTRQTVTGSVVLVDDTATWTPSTTDTAVPGIYDAQVTVTYPDGTVRHFPSKVGKAALSGFVVQVSPSV